jgi:hypothetical protein
MFNVQPYDIILDGQAERTSLWHNIGWIRLILPCDITNCFIAGSTLNMSIKYYIRGQYIKHVHLILCQMAVH